MSLHVPLSCTMEIMATILEDFLYTKHRLGVARASFHLIVLIFCKLVTVTSLIYTQGTWELIRFHSLLKFIPPVGSEAGIMTLLYPD